MHTIHGREQSYDKRNTENVSTGLGRSTGHGETDGDEKPNKTTNFDSSWGNTLGEESHSGGQADDGGILRHLKSIKEGLLAHTQTNQQILEDGLRKNEQYKQEVLSNIDSLQSKIINLLGEPGDNE